jgi:hypothetical protein
MVQELRSFSETLEQVRRARMRALYESEMEMWQEQLAARGLAIERDIV